jgi:NAD(P)-dependent dehydrogenase (short-subunit alcohol dehydrogenase family)
VNTTVAGKVALLAGGAPLWEPDPATLDRRLNVNLRLGYTLIRAAVPVMLSQGFGAIALAPLKAE